MSAGKYFSKKNLSKMDAGKNCVHRWTVQILSMLDSKHFRLNSANKVLALPSPMNLTNCTGRRTNFWLNKVTANNCLQNVPGMVTEINYHRCSPTAAYEFSSRRAKRFQKDGPGNSTRTRKSKIPNADQVIQDSIHGPGNPGVTKAKIIRIIAAPLYTAYEKILTVSFRKFH